MLKILDFKIFSEELSSEKLGASWKQEQKFSETIIDKIFETNFRFHEKYRATWKIQFLFFSNFFLNTNKVFEGRLGTRLEWLISEDLKSVVWQLLLQLVHTITNKHTPFRFWQRRNVVKPRKFSSYYDHDCSLSFSKSNLKSAMFIVTATLKQVEHWD